MKKVVAALLFVVVLGTSVVLYAATKSKAKPPVLTPVTVAVDGFHCQACPDGLQKDLAKLSGASDVKATLKPAQVSAKLDETKLSASEFVAAVSKHPQAMDAKKTYTGKLVVYIDAEMCRADEKMCEGCFKEIPRVLKTVKGIDKVSLDETGKVASITFTKGAKVTTKAIAAALAKSDYKFIVKFDHPLPVAKDQQSEMGGCSSCAQ